MSLSETELAELAELREAERDRLDQKDQEAEARELEALKLAKQLAEETGGRRGRDFEVVTTEYGVFGLKRPAADQVKRWNKITDRDFDSDSLIPILRDHIVGSPEKKLAFHAAASGFPGVVTTLSRVFMRLMGVEVDDAKKK